MGTSRKDFLTRLQDELRKEKRFGLVGWHPYQPSGRKLGYCFIGKYGMAIVNDTYDFWDAQCFKTTSEINDMVGDLRADEIFDLRDYDSGFVEITLDLKLLKQHIKAYGGRRRFVNEPVRGTDAWKIGGIWFNPVYLYDMACLIHGSQKNKCMVHINRYYGKTAAWFYNSEFEVGMVLPIFYKE